MNDYRLKFIEKETGKEFRGRRIESGKYSIITDEALNKTETFAHNDFRKRFRACRKNRAASAKGEYSRPRLFSARTYSKEYVEYLNSSREMMKENAS